MNSVKFLKSRCQNLAKAGRTRWIGHKMRQNIVLQNYGVFITHLESLAKTDSQDIKRAEIAGFVNKWQYAKLSTFKSSQC